MRPMNEAPRDGTEIAILQNGTWLRATWYDAAWLRDGPDGDPAVTDCWRRTDDGETLDIELDEAEGWLPVSAIFGES